MFFFKKLGDYIRMLLLYLSFATYCVKDLRRFLSTLRSKSCVNISIGGLSIKIRPTLTDYFTIWEVFIYRIYEPETFDLPPKLDVVLDLGSFFGDFSLWIKQNYDVRKLIAVELDKENYDLTKTNLQINGFKDSVILNLAIFNSDGKEIGVSNYNPKWTNLLRISETSDINKVKTITLATLLKDNDVTKVSLLKMDIEGSEKYVLTKENEKLFKNKIERVVFEAHSFDTTNIDSFISYFTDLGYKVKFARAKYKPELPTFYEVEAVNINIIK